MPGSFMCIFHLHLTHVPKPQLVSLVSGFPCCVNLWHLSLYNPDRKLKPFLWLCVFSFTFYPASHLILYSFFTKHLDFLSSLSSHHYLLSSRTSLRVIQIVVISLLHCYFKHPHGIDHSPHQWLQHISINDWVKHNPHPHVQYSGWSFLQTDLCAP